VYDFESTEEIVKLLTGVRKWKNNNASFCEIVDRNGTTVTPKNKAPQNKVMYSL
jgi:hypothetical protein